MILLEIWKIDAMRLCKINNYKQPRTVRPLPYQERPLKAKLITMNNVHPIFEPILTSIFPLSDSTNPLKERLIVEYKRLQSDLEIAGPSFRHPVIMNMARIKTILRERYDYTVTY